MTIIAKPVIDNKFWVLQENNKKVGNVEALDGGYQVKINNQVVQFKTIKMVEQGVDIRFESSLGSPRKPDPKTVNGYQASGKVTNPVWDVTRKLPLYTKSDKSKSWFAAGWYQVKRGKNWKVINSPKLIVLQRYDYVGPFFTKEEAESNEQY